MRNTATIASTLYTFSNLYDMGLLCVEDLYTFLCTKVMGVTFPFAHTHTHEHGFIEHFPGKSGLAGCPLDQQSPTILILTILTQQAKTLHTHMILPSQGKLKQKFIKTRFPSCCPTNSVKVSK